MDFDTKLPPASQTFTTFPAIVVQVSWLRLSRTVSSRAIISDLEEPFVIPFLVSADDLLLWTSRIPIGVLWKDLMVLVVSFVLRSHSRRSWDLCAVTRVWVKGQVSKDIISSSSHSYVPRIPKEPEVSCTLVSSSSSEVTGSTVSEFSFFTTELMAVETILTPAPLLQAKWQGDRTWIQLNKTINPWFGQNKNSKQNDWSSRHRFRIPIPTTIRTWFLIFISL